MLDRWGRFTHRHRWRILIVSLVAITAAGIFGPAVFGAVNSAGGFQVPGSESDRAATVLEHDLPGVRADVVVLYTAENMTVDDPAYRDAVTQSLDGLPADSVAGSVDYWTMREQAAAAAGGQSSGEDPAAGLLSHDRRSTYAAVEIVGDDEQARVDAFEAIEDELHDVRGVTAQVGGPVATQSATAKQTQEDVSLAESLSMPLLLVLLLIVFTTLAAALVPLVVAGMATLGSFAVLYLVTLGTDVSIFAITITTILSMILAVDYGLFLVSRYREELSAGRSGADALGATMATAGRTVAVSGVILMVSLAGLLLFPQMFLRSMGLGGIATVLVALVGALVVLPALLAVLGPRVDSLRVLPRRRLREAGAKPGAWRRLANGVMRRPVAFLAGPLVVLLALSVPVLDLVAGGVDERVLAEGAQTRQVAEQLTEEFPANVTAPIDVVVSGASATETGGYIDDLAKVPGATGAQLVGSSGETVHITVGYSLDWQSSEARELVADVRAVPPPDGAEVLVGGRTADLADQFEALTDALPWAGLLLFAVTFVMLFVSFGSVVLPVKAIVMNLLSVATSFGVLVWIFQDGHLSDLLGFTPTGTLDPSSLVLILVLLFGLSMDYEVFLLSRVREQYEAGGDTAEAVGHGLQRTGGIITAAALLLLVVVGAFSFSGITFIKMIGIGMLVAITVDVLVIRLLMVPAALKLLGPAAWWSPRVLARLHHRFRMREAEPPTVPVAAAGDEAAGGTVQRPAARTPQPAGRGRGTGAD